MVNWTINPFTTTPKEAKKQPVEPIGGKMGFFDETEKKFDEYETIRFVSQKNFKIEPAAVITEAEAIIREAAAKPAKEQNTIYGEYQGTITIGESVKPFLEQTIELTVDPAGPREINISPSDQKEAFAALFSAGTDTLKGAATKVASTIADVGETAMGVMKDTVTKDVLGLGGNKERPKTAEEIEKVNKDAAQRVHEQKFWANLPVYQPEVSVFELDNQVVSRSQLEAALGLTITTDHIDNKGGLKANKKAEGNKAMADMARQQEVAAQKANTLAIITNSRGNKGSVFDPNRDPENRKISGNAG